MSFQRIWSTASSIRTEDNSLPVRQVYVWIVTSDKRVVLVSKDGSNWQFPGGKPEPSETLIQTAVREVKEETGLDITDHTNDLTFFGYFTITEPDNDPTTYLQVRYILHIDKTADELSLHVGDEDTAQGEEEVIKFAEAVSEDEALKRISWLSGSPDYRTLKEQSAI